MDPKIQSKDLDFFYGNKQVLKRINLGIREHQITALMGPSGCGKSTFLRSLNRMNDIISGVRVSGQVLLDGQDIYVPGTDIVKIRQTVGMVFQQPNPLPKSIFENVAFGPKVLGINHRVRLEEIVERSLRAAALWEEVKNELKKSGLALSGGQQQRLCIARALAIEPEIVLFDEPAFVLDPISTAKLEELLGKLKKNYTIVIVTHNLQQAARISDWTAFLMLGDLVEFDKTEKIFTTPQDKRTENYLTGKFG